MSSEPQPAERPDTEPKWGLIRVPWKDDKHALDAMTAQLMFDFLDLHGFDQRRVRLMGLPKEVWEKIPKGIMLIEQLGKNDEKPTYTNEDLVEAYETRDVVNGQQHYLEPPVPGQDAYELYKNLYERTSGAAARLAETAAKELKILGVQL